MPETKVRIYQETDGSVPLLEWLDDRPAKVQDKCIILIERLREEGYDLRRPVCDILRDGVYELRAKHQNVNYRILYSFVGECIVLLSHGCTKKKKVPEREIEKAMLNREKYVKDPEGHTYEGDVS
jgi:hypothetical protein